ncbi:GNAT family N-acetyltransferase [Metallococcus carri]|uniref:GNAT family N-acetyltransferase n=1 Tax=Metallococcus carri TaxID=1656884 RepID=UPI001A9F53DC|nr:GNAT family N-acetyltransferase [Metallococcus carri]
MSSEVRPLYAEGERVWVRSLVSADLAQYRSAVEASAERIGQWNPVSTQDLLWHLERQSADHRTFLIHARQREAAHDLVGKVNVSNVIRGRFQSATMGYDSYDPYNGRGLFSEGMRLILRLGFDPAPAGMGLHRIEANVRPGNTRSAGLLRSLGFRREGFVRDMLLLEAQDEPAAWRDHDSYALTAGEDTAAYRDNEHPRVVVLVNGLPGSGKTTIARRVAAELGIPLWSKDILKETLYDEAAASQLMWRLLADSPSGGVLDNNLRQSDLAHVQRGLASAGIAPERVLQVIPADAEPLPIGRVFRIDTRNPLTPNQIVNIALHARATALG